MTTTPVHLTSAELTRRFFGRECAPPRLAKRSVLTPAALHLARETRKELADPQSIDERSILAALASAETVHGVQLSDIERAAAVDYLSATGGSYGPLTGLLRNPSITDVIVRRFDDVTFQVARRNYATDIRFPDALAYHAYIESLLARCGKSCTLTTPVVDVALEPTIRLCVTHESFSPPDEGPTLTLRVHRHQFATLDDLALAALAPKAVLHHLRDLMSIGDQTLIVSGEVGAGKTTLARALAHDLPATDAVVVIEDTHELALHRPFCRTLLTRDANSEGAGKITAAQAIRTAMRMAMNRLILGEIRDAEAADAFIDTAASGHTGLTTIHARNAKDALLRLQHFLRRAHPSADGGSIAEHISRAVGAVVHLAVDASGTRRITEVIEVGESSEGMLTTQPLVVLHGTSGHWRKEGGASLHYARLCNSPLLALPRGSILSASDLELHR